MLIITMISLNAINTITSSSSSSSSSSSLEAVFFYYHYYYCHYDVLLVTVGVNPIIYYQMIYQAATRWGLCCMIPHIHMCHGEEFEELDGIPIGDGHQSILVGIYG